jgi:hypothetical protein
MKAIASIEVEAIKQAINEEESEIQLLYIVVSKKTNFEMYAQGIYEEDDYKNVVPGTVIDSRSGITG